MDEAKTEIKKMFKEITSGKYNKRFIRTIVVLILFVTLTILAGSVYFLTVDDGTYKEDDWSSAPYAASQYTNGVSINDDGTFKTDMQVQELWDKMLEEKNRVNLYLDTPEELARLMKAELVTQYPDTRPYPDEEINWDDIKDNADMFQGIIKFKRADTNGNRTTMSYVKPEVFQGYIDEYNKTGSEEAKEKALTHFTLKKSSDGTQITHTGAELYWPTDGTEITSQFGYREAPTAGATENHGAIDIAVSTGTNVYACEKGTVTIANFSSSAGNWVVIDHGNGYVTKYMHNNELRVSAGDTVEKGQVIALSGSTGVSTGPHVHFQIEYNGTAVDPLEFKYHNGMGNGTGGFGISDDKEEKDKEENEEDKKEDKDKKDKDKEKQKATETTVNGDGYTQVYTSSAGITYKHFKQSQGSYAGYPYWDGTVSSDGCGPSSVAILASGLLNSDYTPGDIAAQMTATYGSKDTTSSGNLKGEMDSLGMPSEVIEAPSAETIQDNLRNGKVMLVSVNSNTIFTSISHLMALVDINEQGQVYVCNPGSSTLQGWYDIEEIVKGCKYIVVTDAGEASVAKSKNKSNYVAMVATWYQKDTTIESNDPAVGENPAPEYSMTTKPINYEEMVEVYTMPFDMLWALLVVGEDKKFIFELIDLIYGSEIEITIHDNLTIDTDIDEWHYTQKTRAEVSGSITAKTAERAASGQITKHVHPEPEKDKLYTTTKTVVTQTNTLNIALTKANVWIVKYENEYTYVAASEVTSENTITKRNEAYPTTPSYTGDSYSCEHITSLRQKLAEKVQSTSSEGEEGTTSPVNFIENINVNYYTRFVDIYDNVTNITKTQKYVQGLPDFEEKTDPKADEPNFVTIFNKPKYKKNRNRIKNVADWLFEIIENNESTEHLLDLIKYLLYKATGNVYDGIEYFDFSIFYPMELSTVGEGDYIVHIDKSSPDIVIKDVETLKLAFSGYSGGGKLIEHAQEYLDLQEQYRVNAVFAAAVAIAETSGGRDGHAIDGKNNWYNIECVHDSAHGRFENYGSAKQSIEAFYKQISVKNYYFTAGKFTVSEIGATYCPEGTEGWIENVTTFMTQMFNAAGINPTTSGTNQTGTKIVEAAKSKLGCPYVWGAEGPDEFDCSGLTKWSYKQVGIDLYHNTEEQKKHATKIVSVSEARVGDILYKKGHVGIYIGNNQFIHAPTTGDVVKISDNVNQFTYALQYF